MTFIFRNRTIFWDISKWNRGQKKWEGGSIWLGFLWFIYIGFLIFYTELTHLAQKKKKKKKKNLDYIGHMAQN